MTKSVKINDATKETRNSVRVAVKGPVLKAVSSAVQVARGPEAEVGMTGQTGRTNQAREGPNKEENNKVAEVVVADNRTEVPETEGARRLTEIVLRGGIKNLDVTGRTVVKTALLTAGLNSYMNKKYC